MKTLRSSTAAWLHSYGKATFLSWDFLLAAGLAGVAVLLFSVSEEARHAGPILAAAAVGVCAGLLGLVLAAMTVVIAFVNRTFVLLVGSLAEALMPFATIAVVSAASLGVGMTAMVALEPLYWALDVVVLSLLVLLTAWTIAGVVQLVNLAIYFARLRAAELEALEHADGIKRHRLSAGTDG